MGTATMARTIPATIQTSPADPLRGEWTYEAWQHLPDDGYRYEVLDGELFMTPPPTIEHQSALLNLVVKMANFVMERRLGKVLTAPCGVRLPGQSVPIQPDIFFVSAGRRNIVGKEYVEGAPDLVIEVLSPSNWLYDRREKMQAYQHAGVAEYWIVDPRAQTIDVFALEQDQYTLLAQYASGASASSRILPGFVISVDDVFAE